MTREFENLEIWSEKEGACTGLNSDTNLWICLQLCSTQKCSVITPLKSIHWGASPSTNRENGIRGNMYINTVKIYSWYNRLVSTWKLFLRSLEEQTLVWGWVWALHSALSPSCVISRPRSNAYPSLTHICPEGIEGSRLLLLQANWLFCSALLLIPTTA